MQISILLNLIPLIIQENSGPDTDFIEGKVNEERV